MKPDKTIDCWELTRIIAEHNIYSSKSNEEEIRNDLIADIEDFMLLSPKELVVRGITKQELTEFTKYLKKVEYTQLSNYIALA